MTVARVAGFRPERTRTRSRSVGGIGGRVESGFVRRSTALQPGSSRSERSAARATGREPEVSSITTSRRLPAGANSAVSTPGETRRKSPGKRSAAAAAVRSRSPGARRCAPAASRAARAGAGSRAARTRGTSRPRAPASRAGRGTMLAGPARSRARRRSGPARARAGGWRERPPERRGSTGARPTAAPIAIRSASLAAPSARVAGDEVGVPARGRQDGDRVAERAEPPGDPGDVLVHVVRLRPRERGHEADLHLTECRVAPWPRSRSRCARAGPIARRSAPLGEDPRRRPGGVRRAARGAGARPRRAEGGRGPRPPRRPASATPISTPPPVRTCPATRRRCSARGRRRRRAGEEVASLAPGDYVVTLFSPQCRECVHCRSTRTNLCLAIREEQGKGHLPDGTVRLRAAASRSVTSWARRPSPSTRSCPRSRSRRSIRRRLPGAALFACGLDRPRRGDEDGSGRAGVDVRRLRRRHGRPRRGRGLPAPGCGADHLRRPLRGATRARQGTGRDRDDGRRAGRGRADPRDHRRLRRRLHLRGHGQRRGHAPGGRVGADGLGPLHRRGRRRQGRDARGRAALSDHRPPDRRSSFGGIKGRDEVPQLVERCSPASSTSIRSSPTP